MWNMKPADWTASLTHCVGVDIYNKGGDVVLGFGEFVQESHHI